MVILKQQSVHFFCKYESAVNGQSKLFGFRCDMFLLSMVLILCLDVIAPTTVTGMCNEPMLPSVISGKEKTFFTIYQNLLAFSPMAPVMRKYMCLLLNLDGLTSIHV